MTTKNNLAEAFTPKPQPDELAEAVKTVEKDAQKDPEKYLKDSVVPEGGE